jgi:predicted transcriptional regulator
VEQQNQKLTERIQVLLSEQDVQDLYQILNKKAVDEKLKPETISGLLRKLTKKFIKENK